MTPRIEANAAPVLIPHRPLDRGQTPRTDGPTALPSLGIEGRRAQPGQPMPTDAPRAPQPTTRLEYHPDRSVLKVHDNRGTLIYQIPSAGTLLLIEQSATADPALSVRA